MRSCLRDAKRVVSSNLTIVECERALSRLAAEGGALDVSAPRMAVGDIAAGWSLFDMDEAIRARAGQPFPAEPVRTLDAIHLATLLAVRDRLGSVHLLTRDARMLSNARALAIPTVP